MRHSIPLLIIVTLMLGVTGQSTASTRTPSASIDVQLMPDNLQPGEEYEIRYSTTEPGFVILYSIDTRGYINLLYPLAQELDGDGEMLPNQEYALPRVVAGVRSGQERVVALFSRNHIEIPEHRWEFLSRDPLDIIEINYSLTRRTSGLSNYSVTVLDVAYFYQGATSPDYEIPQRTEVVHVYLYTPDPWMYYSGYHHHWWWYYDRYWYPHHYCYWRVSWHAWYGPFYDPWYGPWYYSWHDPWYYHHHGHYAYWGGYHYSGWNYQGDYTTPPPANSPPRVRRDLDRRRTASAPSAPEGPRIIPIPSENTITALPVAKNQSTTPVIISSGKTVRTSSVVQPVRQKKRTTITTWHGKRKQTTQGASVVTKKRQATTKKPAAIKVKSKQSSSSDKKSGSTTGGKKKQSQADKKLHRRN